MKNKLFSLLAVLIVLFGFIGCPEPEESGMQVYNADKTTKYTGGDLDFYIQGDAAKTICAKIRKGKLTIDKINLPAGLSTTTFDGATDGLERLLLILITIDDSKKLNRRLISSTVNFASIHYSNKDGSFNINSITHNVKQGWNFIQNGIGSSINPDDAMFTNYRWVVENL